MNAQQLRAAQDAAAGKPQAPVVQKPAPKKQAPKKQAPKKPVDAMAGSDASATNQSSGMTAQDRANATPATAPAATGQEAPSAELDRLKQLAIGGTPPAPAPEAPYGGAAANAMAAKSAPTPVAQTNPLGVTAQSGAAFGQPAPVPDQPAAQAAQPAPAPAAPAPAAPAPAAQAAEPVKTAQDFAPQPNISPDTGLSTAPKPVTTGTGAKTNITTGSDDEMAWRSKQTGIVDVTKYPGPGNWDPKTGRTKQDPNKPGFFDRLFGKKTAPAAPVQGQGSQPVELPPGFAESSNEVDRIRKLSGLR